MTHDPDRNTITLRALDEAPVPPLSDRAVRRMVVATAHAIAERNGVNLLRVTADDDRVTATLACSRLAAIGFAAELRRLTENWYRQHTGEHTLWGIPTRNDLDEPDEDWGLDLDEWKDHDEG